METAGHGSEGRQLVGSNWPQRPCSAASRWCPFRSISCWCCTLLVYSFPRCAHTTSILLTAHCTLYTVHCTLYSCTHFGCRPKWLINNNNDLKCLVLEGDLPGILFRRSLTWFQLHEALAVSKLRQKFCKKMQIESPRRR
jgi:hypothetical protein